MREYTTAFETLNSTRSYGMGPNPISLTEMLAYLQLYGAEDSEAFIDYMIKMDASFLRAMSKKMERDKANGSKSSP